MFFFDKCEFCFFFLISLHEMGLVIKKSFVCPQSIDNNTLCKRVKMENIMKIKIIFYFRLIMFNNQIEEQLMSARSEILSGNHRKHLKYIIYFFLLYSS
jgi:hypothetical protein